MILILFSFTAFSSGRLTSIRLTRLEQKFNQTFISWKWYVQTTASLYSPQKSNGFNLPRLASRNLHRFAISSTGTPPQNRQESANFQKIDKNLRTVKAVHLHRMTFITSNRENKPLEIFFRLLMINDLRKKKTL